MRQRDMGQPPRRSRVAVTLVALLGSTMTTGLVTAGASAAPATTEADAEPATVSLTLPIRSRSDLSRVVSVDVADAEDGPVEGRQVDVQVRTPEGSWDTATVLTTGPDGSAVGEVLVPRSPVSQRWRALAVADEAGTGPSDPAAAPLTSEPQTLDLVPWPVRVRREGADRVIDGRRLRQTWTVTTRAGSPVPGATVVVRSRMKGQVTRRELTSGRLGRVAVRERPRWDSRWVANVRPGTWHEGGAADVTLVDNLPSGPVVVLPRDAPLPTIDLPAQRRVLKEGPNPSVTTIPNRVWREMRGVTWRRGCPVGRSNLRLVRVNYWAYDGYARRGEIVVNAATAYNVASTFADIYRSRLPIRSMYRVDRFGYSSRVNGGDDFASMDAGNTSGFNCRNVVNYSARSPHSYGFAIDINTWENPYRSRQGIVPNVYWQYHAHPLVAWRSSSHPMVQLLYRHGWSWPYGLGDTQHFSAPASGRYARAAGKAAELEHLLEHAGDLRGHHRTTGYVPGTRIPLD